MAYLKPERAYPNVVPYRSNFKEIYEAIKDLLPKTPIKSNNFSSTDFCALPVLKKWFFIADSDAPSSSVVTGTCSLLTLGKRFKLLERAASKSYADEKCCKKLKLSSTPEKRTKSLSTNGGWDDLWATNSDVSPTPSSTSSSPKSVSPEIPSTQTPTKQTQTPTKGSGGGDDWICLSSQASDAAHQSGDGVKVFLSQKSDKDLFEEENSFDSAKSGKDLFDNSDETIVACDKEKLNNEETCPRVETEACNNEVKTSGVASPKPEGALEVLSSPNALLQTTVGQRQKDVKITDEEVIDLHSSLDDSFSSLSPTQPCLVRDDSSTSVEIISETIIVTKQEDTAEKPSSLEIIEVKLSDDVQILFEKQSPQVRQSSFKNNCNSSEEKTAWLNKKALNKLKNP